MRHQKSGKKFGRESDHRHAMLENLTSSLIEHEKIQTTLIKAKELRRFAEPAIAWAASVAGILGQDTDKRSQQDAVQVVHAMRMAQRTVKTQTALRKLFGELGVRYKSRPVGYLRIIKTGWRHGDAAPMAIVELVDRPADATGTDAG